MDVAIDAMSSLISQPLFRDISAAVSATNIDTVFDPDALDDINIYIGITHVPSMGPSNLESFQELLDMHT